MFVDEVLEWIKRQKDGPFFLYLPLTIPHANNEGPIEPYDLSRDPGEKYNIARGHPDIAEEIEAIMKREHQYHPNWSLASSR